MVNVESKGREVAKVFYETLGIAPNRMEDEVSKEVIIAFLFGLISAFTMDHQESNQSTYAIMMAILVQDFAMDMDQALEKHQMLLDSTVEAYHPNIYRIIHQGIYGYELYKNNNYTDLKKLVEKLIEIIKRHSQ